MTVVYPVTVEDYSVSNLTCLIYDDIFSSSNISLAIYNKSYFNHKSNMFIFFQRDVIQKPPAYTVHARSAQCVLAYINVHAHLTAKR